MRLPERARRCFRLPLVKPPVADDVRAEIAFHLKATTQELIYEGWHPEAARTEALRRKRFERPAPDTIPDTNFGIMSEVYDDSVTFRLPLASGPRPRRGRNRLLVAVTWQACTSRLCLLPRTDSVAVTIRPIR